MLLDLSQAFEANFGSELIKETFNHHNEAVPQVKLVKQNENVQLLNFQSHNHN